MPKLKKLINYSILIKKTKKKTNKQKLFSFKQKFNFLLIKMIFFSEEHIHVLYVLPCI